MFQQYERLRIHIHLNLQMVIFNTKRFFFTVCSIRCAIYLLIFITQVFLSIFAHYLENDSCRVAEAPARREEVRVRRRASDVGDAEQERDRGELEPQAGEEAIVLEPVQLGSMRSLRLPLAPHPDLLTEMPQPAHIDYYAPRTDKKLARKKRLLYQGAKSTYHYERTLQDRDQCFQPKRDASSSHARVSQTVVV